MKEERLLMGRRRPGGMMMRWRVWDGVVGLILGLVVDVGVGEEDGEKGVFEMLGPWAAKSAGRARGSAAQRGSRGADAKVDWDDAMEEGRRKEVKEVLGMLNPDLLWLVVERARLAGGGKAMDKPRGVGGNEFRDLQLLR